MSKRATEDGPDAAPAKRLKQLLDKYKNRKDQLTEATNLRLSAVSDASSIPRTLPIPAILEAQSNRPDGISSTNDPPAGLSAPVPDTTGAPSPPAPPFDPEALVYMDKKLQEIFDLAKDLVHGKNVFITGPAGSGKSWLIKQLASKFHQINIQVQIIAPTGSAALNVGGLTCDSFYSLGRNSRQRPLSKLIQLGQITGMRTRLSTTQVLIIDEISMVGGQWLEQMHHITSEARKSKAPFGGLRLIAVGDFAQLPPVLPQAYCITCGSQRLERKKRRMYYCASCNKEVSFDDQWAFRSPLWRELKFRNILLERILRQQQEDYKAIVWQLFYGNGLKKRHMDILKTRSDLPGATMHLHFTNNATDTRNMEKYLELKGEEMVYTADDRSWNPPAATFGFAHNITQRDPGTPFLTIMKGCTFPERLRLKIGTPVVLISNIRMHVGLVNGMRGTVVGWNYIEINDVGRIAENPHEDFGLTWDVNEGLVSEDSVPSLREASDRRNSHRIRHFMTSFENTGVSFPIVEFENGIVETIYPACSTRDFAYGNAQATEPLQRDRGDAGDDEEDEVEDYYETRVTTFTRTQIPLLPAWAMTIHRSQGLTINNYVANLGGRTFCSGLEYVALTRATKFEALAIRGLGRHLTRSELPVRQFMRATFPQLSSCINPDEEIPAQRARANRR